MRADSSKRFTAWKNYHRANPRVFDLFITYANAAREAGRKRIGARLVGERIRWFARVEANSEDAYLINDHHWPYYARLAMLVDSRLEGLFSRRDANFDCTDDQIRGFYKSCADLDDDKEDA